MEVKRENVFLVDLNPVVGTEQSGIRPALVIQIDKANARSPHTVVIPFTTKIRQAILPSHVKVPAGIGGLQEDSVLLCEQIRVIDKRRLLKRIGKIDKACLAEIHKGLKTILGLE